MPIELNSTGGYASLQQKSELPEKSLPKVVGIFNERAVSRGRKDQIEIYRKNQDITPIREDVFQKNIQYIIKIKTPSGQETELPINITLTTQSLLGHSRAIMDFDKDITLMDGKIIKEAKKILKKNSNKDLINKRNLVKSSVLKAIISKKSLEKTIVDAIKNFFSSKKATENNVLDSQLSRLTYLLNKNDYTHSHLNLLLQQTDEFASFENVDKKRQMYDKIIQYAEKIIEKELNNDTADFSIVDICNSLIDRSIEGKVAVLKSFVLNSDKQAEAANLAKATGTFVDLPIIEKTLTSLLDVVKYNPHRDDKVEHILRFGLLVAESLDQYKLTLPKSDDPIQQAQNAVKIANMEVSKQNIYAILNEISKYAKDADRVSEALISQATRLSSVVDKGSSIERESSLKTENKPLDIHHFFREEVGRATKERRNEVAKLITNDLNQLSDHIFHSVPRYEGSHITAANKQEKLTLIPQEFDRISNLVSMNIVLSTNPEKALKTWLIIANQLIESRNYFAAGAIHAAINKSQVTRLLSNTTNTEHPPVSLEKIKTAYNKIQNLFDIQLNKKNYYDAINRHTLVNEKFYPHSGYLFTAYTFAKETFNNSIESITQLNSLIDQLKNTPHNRDLYSTPLKTNILDDNLMSDNDQYAVSRQRWAAKQASPKVPRGA